LIQQQNGLISKCKKGFWLKGEGGNLVDYKISSHPLYIDAVNVKLAVKVLKNQK